MVAKVNDVIMVPIHQNDNRMSLQGMEMFIKSQNDMGWHVVSTSAINNQLFIFFERERMGMLGDDA